MIENIVENCYNVHIAVSTANIDAKELGIMRFTIRGKNIEVKQETAKKSPAAAPLCVVRGRSGEDKYYISLWYTRSMNLFLFFIQHNHKIL